MATSCATSVSVSSSSTPLDATIPRRYAPASSPQCVTLPKLPPQPVQYQTRSRKTATSCRKHGRIVMARATGEASTEVASTELPEIVNTVQEAWGKIEDKYAVTSLAVAGLVALWGSTGLIAAIDKLPLVPSVLELVGIGYTGWFSYKNLIYQPDREALIEKVKDAYNGIIGGS